MPLRVMLDTDTVSNLMRNPDGRVARRLALHGPDTACVSVVSAAELFYGALRAGSARLITRVEEVLACMTVLAFEPPSDLEYGRVRTELQASGLQIGPNDTLIAAHARSLKLKLVTGNTAEFHRVAGLLVENWLV